MRSDNIQRWCLRTTFTVLLLGTVFSCSQKKLIDYATLVVTDAKIWTGDNSMPWAEAIASKDDIIVAIGNAADVATFIGPNTKVISVPGSMLVPGFIDTHVHFVDGGRGLASVQLRDAKTPDEFTRRIKNHIDTLNPGEWVFNGAWDHTLWGGELPRRDWIDAISPQNPVWIYRLDGHMALANSLALKIAGIDASTANVSGGEIIRDKNGNPTGLLKDNAMDLMVNALPPPTPESLDREINAAMQYVASNGVTSVHDMGDFSYTSYQNNLAAYQRAKATGQLITRIYAVAPLTGWQKLKEDIKSNGRGDHWLKTGGLKGFMDGSLGSHTAAFLEPFSDTPDDSGFLINTLDDMHARVNGADQAGLHVMVHAIGDSAIRDLLDIYADVAQANGDKDRRFRIEHAQHIHPDDIPRFARQNIIASMQPYHAIDDGRWAEEVIGSERIKTTYAFRSLMDQGGVVAFGSDWFVAPPTPLEGIYAAVTRRTLDDANPNGWVPEQKITVEQALRAYTRQAAFASFEEDSKGTLRVGMLADFVLLDRVLTEIPAEKIRDAKVLYTIVDGRVVYSKSDK